MTRETEKIKEAQISKAMLSIENRVRHAYNQGYEQGLIASKQEPCEDVCEWFEQYVNIATDIVELRFSDGTVKRAKRGLYMRDIEENIRKMLIDQIANEKKQEPCEDAISRQAVDEIKELMTDINGNTVYAVRMSDIRQLQSVTPQQKTGYWIEIAQYSDGKHKIECSECKSHIFDRGHANSFNVKNKYKYCPNCGAKMESEGKNETE